MFAYIFNFYDFLILNVTTLSVLLSIPLLVKRDKIQSDLLLSGFLLNQGGLAAYTVFFYNENTHAVTVELLGGFKTAPLAFCIAMQGLLLYWYSLAMSQQERRLKPWVNLVALVVFLLHILSVFMPEVTAQLTSFSQFFCVIVNNSGFFMFYSIILGIVALRILKQHEGIIRQRYSNIDQMSLKWLWYCSLGFVLTWICASVGHFLFIIGKQEMSSTIGTILNLPPLFLMSVMVVFSQTHRLSIRESKDNEKSNSNEYVPDEEKIRHLNDLMQSVKIYQDPDLRLDGIADSLDLGTRQVSALISKVHNANFYDFVNSYRVQDAATQLRMPENAKKSIQNVFEDAGFNSKSTFNTIFKKTLGATPSEYRAKHSK